MGRLGIIDGLTAIASVTAMQPTECYLLGRDILLEVLEQHTEMARSMFRSLAAMIRNADERVNHTV